MVILSKEFKEIIKIGMKVTVISWKTRNMHARKTKDLSKKEKKKKKV